MACTDCLKCGAFYYETLERCPRCDAPNFICDPDTSFEAIQFVCDSLEKEHKEEKRSKLRELDKLRPKPWWKKLWTWFQENFF